MRISNLARNWLHRIFLGAMTSLPAVAWADWELNLTRGVTPYSHRVYDLHMLILWICVGIGVVVFGAILISMILFRKSRGAVAAHWHENTTVEIVWTLVPFLILVAIAVPATKGVLAIEDVARSDMTIKVTGYQWKWHYEYLDHGFGFFSSLDRNSNAARQLRSGVDPGTVENYLLEVDNRVVVPVGKKIRFLTTAADVIHSWWVPALGWKRDAIPGFIIESWAVIEKAGVYRGQCAELCGRDHAFMPIVVEAVSEADYAAWVEEMKAAQEEAALLDRKRWPKTELVARGEEVYDSNCASCHQPDGEGISGVFPALAGSAVVTGPLSDHLSAILDGRHDDTVMVAFARLLSDADIAALITFNRQAWGDRTADVVQPADIAAARKASEI